ncbi:MAG: fused MFS/spermidine synthase [Bacteroidales bacterium]|nr:fused MFS/spermidine synthase [Bacteroidales bacterium]
MRNRNLLISLIIFFSGALIMVYEIAGSRVLGPYLGTSVFVWTALIGIIMGSLSIGYWLGGKLSVKTDGLKGLAIILSLAALFITITAIANNYILIRLAKYVPLIRLRTIVASIILFAPASIFLGMVLPFSIRIIIEKIKNAGSRTGNLYALSTTGSIAGTFAAGFFLLPDFGFLNVIFGIAILLLLLSSILIWMIANKTLILVPGFVLLTTGFFWFKAYSESPGYIDTDTEYNRVLIYETTDKATGRPVKILKVNDETSSAMFTDNDDGLAFEVLKYYHLVRHFVPGFEHCLMIGGSGYAFPKDYLKKYPDATLDVVEIDPGLTALAKKHFNLPDDPDLNIIHADGRIFLNKNEQRYDAVFMDAYKSILTIPFQLTTKEAVQKIYNSLNEGGAVFANVISALEPAKSEFLVAELATYKSVFPQVLTFAVQYPNPTPEQKSYFQNIMIVGIKSQMVPSFVSQDSVLNSFLAHKVGITIPENTEILTDEYAPVEFLSGKNLK